MFIIGTFLQVCGKNQTLTYINLSIDESLDFGM